VAAGGGATIVAAAAGFAAAGLGFGAGFRFTRREARAATWRPLEAEAVDMSTG
jgi:hypothetical protein